MATISYHPNCRITTFDQADVLVNTVNCVRVMGAGVAKDFRERWPEIMVPYCEACTSGLIRPGTATPFSLPDGRTWVALATKDHWRDPSRYAWVLAGLVQLRHVLEETQAASCALPPPGCGHGKLDWSIVHLMTETVFLGWGGRLMVSAVRPAPAPEGVATVIEARVNEALLRSGLADLATPPSPGF